MARLKQQYETDGYFGIGILNTNSAFNIGTLWRSAYIFGASFIFTIDKKYKKQASDVTRAWTKIPLYHYETFSEFCKLLPYSTRIVGVEMSQQSILVVEFEHPLRSVYLLGCESVGLPVNVLDSCHSIISLPGNFSLNVSVAGSIVMYDRLCKLKTRYPNRL
ncbi:MAG TPA: TrmH family RNA methyltransferase [Crenotrichaceae bacterium]|nr:TrmH family RNA methyltransferase [Crenotrichaceae bacterium]